MEIDHMLRVNVKSERGGASYVFSSRVGTNAESLSLGSRAIQDSGPPFVSGFFSVHVQLVDWDASHTLIDKMRRGMFWLS